MSRLERVVEKDIEVILKEVEYETDLRKMLAFERIFFQPCNFEYLENEVDKFGWDIFKACKQWGGLIQNTVHNIRRKLYLIQLDLDLPERAELDFEQLKFELEVMGDNDIAALNRAQESYGDSWKKRGGVGAYMMMVRKLDRILNQVEKYDWNVKNAYDGDTREDGLWDDLRDMRRYMQLIQAEVDAI